MKPAAYIETSVVSYLAARPSRDLVLAAYQEVTRAWWETAAERFDLVASALVAEEASAGDPRCGAGASPGTRGGGSARCRAGSRGVSAAAGRFGRRAPCCDRRCGAHRDRGSERCRVSGNVEFPAHRERFDARAYRSGVPGGGFRTAGDLHPQRTSGAAECGSRKLTQSSPRCARSGRGMPRASTSTSQRFSRISGGARRHRVGSTSVDRPVPSPCSSGRRRSRRSRAASRLRKQFAIPSLLGLAGRRRSGCARGSAGISGNVFQNAPRPSADR